MSKSVPEVKKKSFKIPIRVVAKSETTDFIASPQLTEETEPKKLDRKSKKTQANKKGPVFRKSPKAERKMPSSKKVGQQRTLYIWVIVVTIIIIAGWVFYFKGFIGSATFANSPLKGVEEKLTNVFSGFTRVFSNVQQSNKIESSSDQDIEEFEQRVFPQFIESE
ncbi:MAG: hypothetical protein ABIB97_03675 [Patescibacteria group bacterium]